MALASFADVQKFFNAFIATNRIDIAGAQHGAFWNTITYDNFVNGNVPNVTDPNTLMTPLICQTGPKTSANSGCSCSVREKRCISGRNLASGIVGIRS
jgi:hypothetical protein